MLGNFFHFVMGLTGLLLLYVGLFLTETEEGLLNNRLEELWVRVDDLQTIAMTRQAALLQQVSSLVAAGLAKLFGQKLVSIKSVAACLCFAMGSIYLSLALLEKEKLPFLSKPTLLLFSLVFFVLGFSRKLRYFSLVFLVFGWLIQLWGLRGTLNVYQASFGEVISADMVYLGGILSVIGSVALIQWSLRLGSHLSNTRGLAAIILLNVALCAALLGPTIFTRLHYQVTTFGPRVGTSLISRPHGFLLFLYGVSNTNLFSALLALAVLLALFAALAHRLVWPSISRPIYAAHRYGMFKQHKLLVALGGTCLLFAWPNNVLVKTIAKAVHLGG